MKVCKSYPHACPVCKGRGELTEELAQHEANPKYDLGDRKIYPCHVCGGGCLIWEYREEEQEVAPTPNPYSIQIGQPMIHPQVLPTIQVLPDPWQQPDGYKLTDGLVCPTWNSNEEQATS